MEEDKRNEVVVGVEDDADRMEVVIEDGPVDENFEDVRDEKDLPPGWEDQLYEEWRERKAMNQEVQK